MTADSPLNLDVVEPLELDLEPVNLDIPALDLELDLPDLDELTGPFRAGPGKARKRGSKRQPPPS